MMKLLGYFWSQVVTDQTSDRKGIEKKVDVRPSHRSTDTKSQGVKTTYVVKCFSSQKLLLAPFTKCFHFLYYHIDVYKWIFQCNFLIIIALLTGIIVFS